MYIFILTGSTTQSRFGKSIQV